MASGSYRNCLYASTTPGAAKATFTSEFQINDVASMKPQAKLTPDFWGPAPADAIGRGIHIYAKGIVSSTATPTFQLNVRGGAAGNVASAPILLGMPAGKATISGAANNVWELEGEVVLEAIGAVGGNSTIRGIGTVRSSGLAVPVADLFGGGASPGTSAVFDTSITNFINVNAICGTSNAANSIQLLQLVVEALN